MSALRLVFVVGMVASAAFTTSTTAATAAAAASTLPGRSPSFVIENDIFLLDGQPFQIISGSMHYFRIHPAYWVDRLQRAKAMGINTVEVYTPWNLHEPYPGRYDWGGMADVERWLGLIQDAGLKVLLRPGPYICAEWDFGGLPWWFGSSEVAGGKTMRMRTSDPAYLAHVDAWWSVLFARLRRFMHSNGGPVLMVQIENEYGFCGDDKQYLRHLIATTRRHLSQEVLLFTTDPAGVAAQGSIAGGEVYTAVDFGPGWFDPSSAFAVQKSLNKPGKSPPFCTEFYSGWLSHWGEPMANTSTEVLVRDTQILLEYANSTTSLSFYMIHGGTNFGFWAGSALDGERFLSHITSYDYDAPISEAGDYCQPGIGGPCKYHALRDLIARHTGSEPPQPPPRPAVQRYGRVELRQSVPLMDALGALYGRGGGIRADVPSNMEEYGQRWGLTLYRTQLPPGALDQGRTLDLGGPVHDYASVFVDGQLAGRLDRSAGGRRLALPAQQRRQQQQKQRWQQREGPGSSGGGGIQLDILVEAMGRVNFGCDKGGWDLKGLTSQNVTLDGSPLRGWQVFPLPLDNVGGLFDSPRPSSAGSASAAGGTGSVQSGPAGGGLLAAARRRLLKEPSLEVAVGPEAAELALPLAEPAAATEGMGGQAAGAAVAPAFFRGTFSIDNGTALRGPAGHLADTYLATHGWGKGVAWVNSFNLGWYWPLLGPQMTLYVPGPVLREGENEVLLLELVQPAGAKEVVLDDAPNFFGPNGSPSEGDTVLPRHRVPTF